MELLSGDGKFQQPWVYLQQKIEDFQLKSEDLPTKPEEWESRIERVYQIIDENATDITLWSREMSRYMLYYYEKGLFGLGSYEKTFPVEIMGFVSEELLMKNTNALLEAFSVFARVREIWYSGVSEKSVYGGRCYEYDELRNVSRINIFMTIPIRPPYPEPLHYDPKQYYIFYVNKYKFTLMNLNTVLYDLHTDRKIIF